mgnify:CR=1 FL=1
MLYEINSKEKHDRVVNEMLRKGFIFPNNMKPYTYEKAKNCYHGNSKLLLHTFYNDMTGKFEMQYTTKSVYLSYYSIHTFKSYREELVV